MKTGIAVATTFVFTLMVGFFIGRLWQSPALTTHQSTERKVLYYKAPMDPNYRRDQPGKSPMGMDLVPVYADESNGQQAGVVRISPSVVNNLGVRTAPVRQGPLSREIHAVGYLGYNEEELQTISTRVDGWIEHLTVSATGDPVSKGQTLLELYSPALVNAQQEYLAAQQSRNLALKKASRERLSALGIGNTEIQRLDRERTVNQRIAVKSSDNGVVVQLGVQEGQYVTAATNVMSIGSLSEVWLLAEVLERQASWVAKGQTALIEVEALPGLTLNGQVSYVYPELDPKTRTITARIALDNSSGALYPNMFAQATILAADTPMALHIPVEALIRGGSFDRVVIATDDGGFRSQRVTSGIESNGRIAITSGLSPGDQVVTSGQFLIDSESNIDNALQRMDPALEKESKTMADRESRP
ncbi:MAG: efflux RND transporter periplasmic adaptor subunit [Lysobacterales bacterium]